MQKKTNLKKGFSVDNTTLENKKKALKAAIDQIEKNFGKGAIMLLVSNQSLDIEAISTGS